MWRSGCLLVLACLAAAKTDSEIDGPVIGIDLGAAYSCAGVVKNGRVEIIPNDQGDRATPSYVAFAEDRRLIGEAAKDQAIINPGQTLFGVKRLIGRPFEDASVQRDAKSLPYKIMDKGGRPMIGVRVGNEERVMAPEEVSSMVLAKLKEAAEVYLGQEVKYAVISVPTYFNEHQRQSTEDAGRLAGLEVLRIISEPTAAAIAYGLDKKTEPEQSLLVYDLSGDTLDVSLLVFDEGVFEVISTCSDSRLGGEAFDQRVMQHFMKLFLKTHGKDISMDKTAIQKLRRTVENTKRILSSTHHAHVEIEALFDGVDFSETLTRALFENLNADLFRKTLGPIKQVLDDVGFKRHQIDEIILVGGSARIPKVRQLIKDFFGGKEPSRGINPDEVVAHGAAIQAGIFSGEVVDDLVFFDATPLSLGIETAGGIMSKFIGRYTAIPTKKSQVFSTWQDNQTAVDIAVFEGERPLTKDNHLLTRFELAGISPAPRGQPQIQVTFEIDANGILHVGAEDDATRRREKSTIANQGRLSYEEIENMIKEADLFADEDRKVKERIDAMHSLDGHSRSMLVATEGSGDSNDGQQWSKGVEAEEINQKQEEVEGVRAPIVSNHSDATGSGGGDEAENEAHDEL